MKKKKLVTALLGTAFAGSLMVQIIPASAAVVSGGSTSGNIGFTGHNQPPTLNGDLDLIWYPKQFDFGNANTNNTAATTYSAVNGQTKYAVVRDNRVANGTTSTPNEWKLVAQASTLVDGSDTLTGAEYQFTGNVLKSYVSASGADTETPESSGAISTTLPGGHTVTAPTNITLPADSATEVNVMQAANPTIDGKYAAELNNISLMIPANTSKEGKQYTGTVTWTLDDTI